MKAARIMQNSLSAIMLKQEFFKKWINGFRIYTHLKKEMTISERRKAIKLSSDVAIASTRIASTIWSRALMANVVSRNVDRASRIVVEKMTGRKMMGKNKALMITCSKKIVRRIRMGQRRKRSVVCTSFKAGRTAEQLVKKRTRVLKRLVPGGEGMDEICLIKETLDYIASLQVQVDVMRKFAAVAERLDPTERSF